MRRCASSPVLGRGRGGRPEAAASAGRGQGLPGDVDEGEPVPAAGGGVTGSPSYPRAVRVSVRCGSAAAFRAGSGERSSVAVSAGPEASEAAPKGAPRRPAPSRAVRRGGPDARRRARAAAVCSGPAPPCTGRPRRDVPVRRSGAGRRPGAEVHHDPRDPFPAEVGRLDRLGISRVRSRERGHHAPWRRPGGGLRRAPPGRVAAARRLGRKAGHHRRRRGGLRSGRGHGANLSPGECPALSPPGGDAVRAGRRRTPDAPRLLPGIGTGRASTVTLVGRDSAGPAGGG